MASSGDIHIEDSPSDTDSSFSTDQFSVGSFSDMSRASEPPDIQSLINSQQVSHGPRLRILVTNDDGVKSDGVRALAMALASIGDVLVVAPMFSMSTPSFRFTTDEAVTMTERTEQMDWPQHMSIRTFAVSGSPTDCVKLALMEIAPNTMHWSDVDLVVSGINKGANLGSNILYSGTVAGAFAGAFKGIPSIAVSLCPPSLDQSEILVAKLDFRHAARFTARLARAVLNAQLFDTSEDTESTAKPPIVLNVNVPHGEEHRFRFAVTRSGVVDEEPFDPVMSQAGGQVKCLLSSMSSASSWQSIPGSDCNAIKARIISVTPLLLPENLNTAYDVCAALLHIDIDGCDRKDKFSCVKLPPSPEPELPKPVSTLASRLVDFVRTNRSHLLQMGAAALAASGIGFAIGRKRTTN